MIASEAFVREADINKVMRLRWYGFKLNVNPVKDGYIVTITTDPRL